MCNLICFGHVVGSSGLCCASGPCQRCRHSAHLDLRCIYSAAERVHMVVHSELRRWHAFCTCEKLSRRKYVSTKCCVFSASWEDSWLLALCALAEETRPLPRCSSRKSMEAPSRRTESRLSFAAQRSEHVRAIGKYVFFIFFREDLRYKLLQDNDAEYGPQYHGFKAGYLLEVACTVFVLDVKEDSRTEGMCSIWWQMMAIDGKVKFLYENWTKGFFLTGRLDAGIRWHSAQLSAGFSKIRPAASDPKAQWSVVGATGTNPKSCGSICYLKNKHNVIIWLYLAN